MRRLVLDPGAVLTWFEADGPGRELRAEYEAGDLRVLGPRHLFADLLALVASSGDWTPDRLASVGAELERLGFELLDPPTARTATWAARLPDARLAPYAALAEHLDLPLVAADTELRRHAARLLLH